MLRDKTLVAELVVIMSVLPLTGNNIKMLSCMELVAWLKARDVTPELCQIFEGIVIKYVKLSTVVTIYYKIVKSSVKE